MKPTYIKEIKIKLNSAFRQLRKEGFLAKQDWENTMTSGIYYIHLEADKLIDQNPAMKEKLRGYVFYHYQDEMNRRRGEEFYIAFGQIDSDKYGKIGYGARKVGNYVSRVLREHGVPVNWNGSSKTRIGVPQKGSLEMITAEA